VESDKEKSAAEAIAKKVDGVKSVHNVLQVVPDSQRKAVDAKDDDIKDAVKARLAKDERLKDASVKVRSDNGLVTLMGSVANVQTKARAADLARGVAGVKAVRNELK
jgi:hyperosmotically inducible protein